MRQLGRLPGHGEGAVEADVTDCSSPRKFERQVLALPPDPEGVEQIHLGLFQGGGAQLHQRIDGVEFWLFNDGNNAPFLFGDSPTSGQYGTFEWDSANGLKIKGSNVAIGNIFPGEPFLAGYDSAVILRLSATLNMGLRTSEFGNGQRIFAMANAQTVPSSNPTGGGVLYVEGGALKYRGAGGTVI